MAHLKELGVDTSDASMCWLRYDADNVVRDYVTLNDEMCYEFSGSEPCPTYTTRDLIEKLSKSDKGGSLLINPANNDIDYGDWVYYDGELCELENFAGFNGKSVIDSLYELICWLVGKKKTTFVQDNKEKEKGQELPETKKNASILDACCGGKMFYFDKDDPRVLFQDIRTLDTELCDGRHFEINPDVVADFTKMPYDDNSFSMVVFDPPHLKYTGSKKEADGWQMIKYGYLSKDWREVLRKGFLECFRVLKPGGFLIFKWNETDIRLSQILKLTPEKPVFGHRSGKVAKTHWLAFMKDKS